MSQELRIATITPADEPDLRRLARLENRHSFSGPGLIARIDSNAVAAIAESGDVVADPFRPTTAIVAALRAVAASEHSPPKRAPGLAGLARFAPGSHRHAATPCI